jgi:hypothetical protein
LHLQAGADGALPQPPAPRDARPRGATSRGVKSRGVKSRGVTLRDATLSDATLRGATLRDVPKPDLDAHFGASSETCHRGADGEILGPYRAPRDAHVSRKHASFLLESRSARYIACHATSAGPVIGIAKDFADGPAGMAEKISLECRMAPVDRPAAIVDGQPPFASRAGRSHALRTPRDPTFLRRAFDIRTRPRGVVVAPVVGNACGHRVPGRIGRVITPSAELLDAAGAIAAEGRHAIERKRSLAADGQVEIELRGAGTRARVVGLHDPPALPREVRFLEPLLELP